MKHILHITALSIAMSASAVIEVHAGSSWATGLAPIAVNDARTDRPLEGSVWYPTSEKSGTQEMHSNAVWQGIEAIPDAAMAEGEFPLVVLSHGMYGNAMNQSWLADALVDEGYIVAAISHPGTSTWLRDPDHARQMWDRPRDLSRLIDHMLSDPAFAGHVDADRIYAAGHSLGGYTAVALAGGRYDAAGFEAFCEARADRELVCGIFDQWQIGQTPQDIRALEQSSADPRVKAFAVFDLGGTQTFSADSLAEIAAPMLVIGAPQNISGLDLDIESRALQAALSPDVVTYLEPQSLSHFDFLGVCKPAGMAILAEEEPGDEIICLDGGASRKADHDMIITAVVGAFSQ